MGSGTAGDGDRSDVLSASRLILIAHNGRVPPVRLNESEPRLHLTCARLGNTQGAAVEILDHPLPFQRLVENDSADGTAKMATTLTPVDASVRQPAALRPSGIHIDAEVHESSRSGRGQVISMVGTV